MLRCVVCGVTVGLLAGVVQGQPPAFQVGDTVVVAEAKVDFVLQGKPVAELLEGTLIEVARTQKQWIAGYVTLQGRLQPGWVKQSQVVSQQDALAHFTAQISNQPKNVAARIARSQIWQRKGDLQRALQDCNDALALQPESTRALANRAATLRMLARPTDALADYDRLLKLQPGNATVLNDRGFTLATVGKYEQAAADYGRAIAVQDEHALAHNNLAWLLATCPDARFRDGKRAVQHARRASELVDGANYEYLDTLAAAEAEAGDFKRALQQIDEAIQRAPADARSRLERRRAAYARQTPHREPAPTAR